MTLIDAISSHERFLAVETELARAATKRGDARAARERAENCRRTREVIARLKAGGYADVWTTAPARAA